MSFISEQDFYIQSKGFPLENLKFAGFSVGCGNNEFDSFGIVKNSYPMYVRIFPLRDKAQFSPNISIDGFYAKLDSNQRDKECPKIAWGFSAYLFGSLNVIDDGECYNRKHYAHPIYSNSDVDFSIDEVEAKRQYSNLLWEDYRKKYSGVRYRKHSEKNKRISFLEQHIEEEKSFWNKTEPVLKGYLLSSENPEAGKLLYDTIKDITIQYHKEIVKQKRLIHYSWFFKLIEFFKRNSLKIFSSIIRIIKILW